MQLRSQVRTKKVLAALPAVALVLSGAAAWAVTGADDPNPTIPSTPTVPGAPALPALPSAPGSPGAADRRPRPGCAEPAERSGAPRHAGAPWGSGPPDASLTGGAAASFSFQTDQPASAPATARRGRGAPSHL